MEITPIYALVPVAKIYERACAIFMRRATHILRYYARRQVSPVYSTPGAAAAATSKSAIASNGRRLISPSLSTDAAPSIWAPICYDALPF